MTTAIVAEELTDEQKAAIKEAALVELRKLIPIEAEALMLSRPSCVQCTATYRDFDSKQVTNHSIDVSQNLTVLELVKQAGYLTAPVVITRDDHWGGFRPDKIDEIVAARLAA